MADVRLSIHPKITIDGEDYRVLSYRISESLSEVSSLVCEIVKDDQAAPDPKAIVDKDAVFTLEYADESQKRTFAGIVVDAARRPAEDEVDSVHLHVAPQMWKLGKRADCRIFQQKTVVDIVKEVLQKAGVPASQTEWKTTESYATRDYTVQYRETDLEFVQRLLSEDGIWFAIHHEDGKDKTIFGDDPKGLGPVEGTTSFGFKEEMGFHEAGDWVMNVEEVQDVRSDKAILRDYDWKKPKLKLEANAEGTDPGSHALEVYSYPGRFTDKAVGDHLTKVLLDSMQAERHWVSGATGVLTMRPGLRFSIEEHPYAPLNTEQLVVSLDVEGHDHRFFKAFETAEGQEASYSCRFRAVPTSKTKYRPPRRDRAKTVPGLQTAITTGPSGEEIHTDEHGAVKAQFHWDRLGKKDDKSSCWMRTSQVPTGGSMFLPRMKWEVTVVYNEGDVDRPYVMGRMYNGATPPPYALPAGKARGSVQTATTPGGGSTNELRTDDTKGKEEMFFNASKDMSVDVKNNTTETVGNNQTRQVGSNQTLDVTNSVTTSIGANQSVTVSGNQDIHVQTLCVDQVGGDHSLSIGGNRTMMIGGDHKKDVGGDNKVTVGGNMLDAIVGSVSEHALGNCEHKVGAALVEITAANKALNVGGACSENTGAVKIIGTLAGRGVDVSGSMMHKVAGAIITSIKGDRADSAGANLTEIAAGAQVVKADNVAFQGETMVSIVMGASTIVIMPAMIVIAGVSLKVDGAVTDEAAMILDN